MGNPIDAVFQDRDAFADFFTRYYTDWEPENCVVAEEDGTLVGYLTGCIHYYRYALVQALLLVFVVLPRAFLNLFRYDRQSLRFVRWFVFRSLKEKPRSPSRAAHFHINLLPEYRTGSVARRLIFGFLESLGRKNISRVYGQIQTYENRRPAKVFERYGFHLYDQRQVTKFARFEPKAVYVSTFLKNIQ